MKKEELYEIAHDFLEKGKNIDLNDYKGCYDEMTCNHIIMRLNYLKHLYRDVDKSNENNRRILEQLTNRVVRIMPGFLLMENMEKEEEEEK